MVQNGSQILNSIEIFYYNRQISSSMQKENKKHEVVLRNNQQIMLYPLTNKECENMKIYRKEA